MPKIYSISLGCPKNRVDTEHCLGRLDTLCRDTKAGPVSFVASPEGADLVFINTCGFIAPAVEESVRVLMETVDSLEALEKRPLLAVAGCLVGRYGAKTLQPDLPEVDLLLESEQLNAWPETIFASLVASDAGEPASCSPSLFPGPERMLSTGPSYAWLKISEGCRHNCSFCTIPSIRGGLRSVPKELLKEEAAGLLDMGVKELILVAQDVTAWGKDTDERHGLVSLLETLLPLDGLERLRLMYLYPAGLTKELLNFLQQAGGPFVPYFDVPVQHAAHNVLSRMGRPFAGKPAEAVERVRSFFPEAALRTSIIVGFPGETDEDFDELCRFVQQTRFHHLGVFAYQAEEGTVAAAMPDQIDEEVKTWRRDTLMAIQAEISEEVMAAYQSQRLPVLVDSEHDEWPGLHVGRTWFQAPEIDGVTYISGKGVFPGALVEADITEASTYDLVALTEPED